MNTVIIQRGVPGQGKSFLTAQLTKSVDQNKYAVCSADHFMHVNGVYQFEQKKLGYAHAKCREKFDDALRRQVPLIIVDNTNTVFSEMKPYIEAANDNKYEILLMEPQTEWAKDPQECFKRNQHGVPLAAIERMLARFHTSEYVVEKSKYELAAVVKIATLSKDGQYVYTK